MGSARVDESSQKELNNELVDAGNRLLKFSSSSVGELLMLLEKAKSILEKVEQVPPKSTGESLLPIKKALIRDELLLHPEVNIQITVACCINELTRVNAPVFPFPVDKIKVIFQLYMVAFKQLSSECPRDYSKSLIILETVAKVRTYVVMVDEASEMIFEMFQHFLNSIRSDHPCHVFEYMKLIMTMVIEESDEISFELLELLLASVRMDNKNISPVSWELGKTVIEKCATTLQPYLREVVKSKNLDLDDYAEIVISLCQITSNGENMKPRRSPIDELVNSRIQVWWPKDKMFHTGTVTAFDPVTEKHMISYDEDLIKFKNLNLRKERWKLFSDKQPQEIYIAQKEEEAVRYHPSPAKEPFQSREKTTKRKAFPSTKQHAPLSSKSESCGLVKSGENSASDIHEIDDLEEETRETNDSFTSGLMKNIDAADGHTQVTKKLKGESSDPINPGRSSSTKINCSMVEEQKVQKPKISISCIPTDPKISVNQDCNEMVDINGYKVKAIAAPILEAIFAKYGNIAANSLFKSKSVTASLLEVVCDIVERLQNYFVEDILLNLEAIENDVSDVEAAKIETSWLRHHLAKFHEVAAFHKENLLLKKSKVNVDLLVEAAYEKLQQRRGELFLAQERVKEAEKCMTALNIVRRKIDEDINVSENEEYFWRRRLGGILEGAKAFGMQY